MRTTHRWLLAAGFIAVFGMTGSTGLAQRMPRLPGEIRLPRSADSPGPVSFFHETHVNPDKPDCTTCHSREFRILKTSAQRRLAHDAFDKGHQCGACHNGKAAFKIEDDCTNCHRG